MKVHVPNFNKKLTQAQAIKIAEQEGKRQLIERLQDAQRNISILYLYYLYKDLGFHNKRLARSAKRMKELFDSLLEYYQMDLKDNAWLAEKKLRDAGIDLDSILKLMED